MPDLAAILNLCKLGHSIRHLKLCANISILENIFLDNQSTLKVF